MSLRRSFARYTLGGFISRWALVVCAVASAGALVAFQKPFRQFISLEAYDNIPLPKDWKEPEEWVFARLMYPQNPEARFGGMRYRRMGEILDWRSGGTSW